MHRTSRQLLVTLATAAIAAWTVPVELAAAQVTRQPASRPARNPRSQADPAAIAAKALTKEAQDALQAKKPLPRTASDYFTDQAEKPTQAQIVAQLGSEISRNPNIDAYVKWQLLSAVPDHFDRDHSLLALKAFVTRPPPLTPVPGAAADGRTMLEKTTYAYRNASVDATGRIPAATQARIDDINDQVVAETQRIVKENELRITYRDELLKRIATDDEAIRVVVLKARLEDLWVRAAAGLDVDGPFKALGNDIRTWAALAEQKAVVQMADFVREYARRKPQEIYEKFEYDGRTRKYEWGGRLAGIGARELANLERDLREAAQKSVGSTGQRRPR